MNLPKNECLSKNRKRLFDFLTGYRGLLAIIVLLHHASYDLQLKGDYNLFKGPGYYVGVVGFFVLSAFLLTHRIIIDLEETNSLKQIVIVCLKYAIRRVFRIYVPFSLFCLILKSNQNIVGGYFTNYSSFFSLITLESVGFNHLWTVGNEIKYYFFIPVFCFIYVKTKRFKKYFVSLLVIFIFITEYFNLFFLTEYDFKSENRHSLKPRFIIFLSGSTMAMIYLQLNKDHFEFKSNISIILFQLFQICLIFYYPYEYFQYLNPNVSLYRQSTESGIYMSLILFVLLTGSPNFTITSWLSNSKFLLSCGNYSFGIYLFHPMVIKINQVFNTKTNIEMLFIIIFFSYICGYIFYYLIEEKSIRIGNYLMKKLKIN